MLVGADGGAVSPVPVAAAPLDVSAVVSSVTPSAGVAAGGTSIDIRGTGFTDASDVVIGGTAVTACPSAGGCFTFNSDTDITAITPPGAAGTSDVTVDNPTFPGTPNPPFDDFTYQQATPAVTSVSADSGPEAGGGPAITIGGSNFSGSGFNTTGVSFGGTAASFSVTNSSTISATPPAGTGLVDITVTTSSSDGTSVETSATSAADTYVHAPVPSVTNVAPSTGPTGGQNQVVLTGTGFESNNAPSASYTASDVFVDTTDITTSPCPGTPSSPCFTVNSPTKITVGFMPPHAVGTIDITVQTSGGVSTTSSGDQYTFEPSPVVTSVVPPAGVLVGGNTVTVNGSGFSSATDVKVGATDITATPCPGSPTSPCFNVTSDAQVTVEDFPAHSAATVDITVTTPFGVSQTSSADTYAFAPIPTVTSLSPHAGVPAGGYMVNVTGSGFESSPNFTTTAVSVGTVGITASPCVASPSAPCYTVNSPTSITIGYMPPEAAGQVNITVATPGGTSAATSQNVFSYDDSLPGVSELLPKDGATAGGEAISLFGSGFGQAGQDFVTDVLFGSTDVLSSNSYPCPNSSAGCFVVVGPTQLAIYTPANSAGTVDVRIKTPAGESGTGAAPDKYTFVPPGAYTAVTPYRVCDTRPPGHGVVANQCDTGSNHTLGTNGIVTAQITQPGGPVPPGAQAVVVNVTAIDHSSTITLVTAYPAGTTRPIASNINLAGDTVESNLVIVQLSQAGGSVPAGAITLYNAAGSADVIVDVEGYFSNSAWGRIAYR